MRLIERKRALNRFVEVDQLGNEGGRVVIVAEVIDSAAFNHHKESGGVREPRDAEIRRLFEPIGARAAVDGGYHAVIAEFERGGEDQPAFGRGRRLLKRRDDRVSVFLGIGRRIRRVMESSAREVVKPAGKEVVRDHGIAAPRVHMRIKPARRRMIERNGGQNPDLSAEISQRFGNGLDAAFVLIQSKIAVDGLLSCGDRGRGSGGVRDAAGDVLRLHAGVYGKVEEAQRALLRGKERLVCRLNLRVAHAVADQKKDVFQLRLRQRCGFVLGCGRVGRHHNGRKRWRRGYLSAFSTSNACEDQRRKQDNYESFMPNENTHKSILARFTRAYNWTRTRLNGKMIVVNTTLLQCNNICRME